MFACKALAPNQQTEHFYLAFELSTNCYGEPQECVSFGKANIQEWRNI
jgi:hypothetical protein